MATNDFSKLWEDFWTSSIQEAPPFTRLFFTSLWGLCDHEGNFTATMAALARRANLCPGDMEKSLKYAQQSMEILLAPDPLSTNREHDGRRVLDLGQNRWHVVSFVNRRDKDDADRRRDYWRKKKREQREKAAELSPEHPANLNGQGEKPGKIVRNTPKEQDECRKLVEAQVPRIREPLEAWLAYRKERKLPSYKLIGLKGLITKMQGMRDPQTAVENSIASNWNGVFEGPINAKPEHRYDPAATVARLRKEMGDE